MRDAGEWYGEYADARGDASPRPTTRPWWLEAGDSLVPILMGHFLVGGVKVDAGAPRGERELHMGAAYTATAQAIPAGPQYVAMGHIHAPQPVPGAPVPAEYAGSLLSLDFGEAGERKRVVVVDVEPGRLADDRVGAARRRGRPLQRVTGTWDADRGSRRRAARALPRPHGAGRRRRYRSRPPSGRDVPLPRERAGAAPRGHARRSRPAGDGRPTDEELYAEFARARRARIRRPSSWRCSARCSRKPPMRPLELRLKGFRSYREETGSTGAAAAWSGIVGPIGAGKSSILDAIAFALYGKTPTFERDTKSLINQTASECHVELRFEVDGQVWRAARGLRRKGRLGPPARAARLRRARRRGGRVDHGREARARAGRTAARHGLQRVLPVGAARAESVRRLPEGDAARSERGAEGRLRVRTVRRGARGSEAPGGGGDSCCSSRSSGRGRSSLGARATRDGRATPRVRDARGPSALEAARAPFEEATAGLRRTPNARAGSRGGSSDDRARSPRRCRPPTTIERGHDRSSRGRDRRSSRRTRSPISPRPPERTPRPPVSPSPSASVTRSRSRHS